MSGSDLESQLRAGGEVVSEGGFKVDAQRALQKLREHRLAEPHHWVLEVLRAAHLCRPKRVDVRIDADDVEVVFDGKPFGKALMNDLLAQSLASGEGAEEQRGRLLSLGVAGALALKPKWIRVESGGVKLEILAGEKVVISESDQKGTRVAVRKSLGWNVLAGLVKQSPEHAAILDRARWFSCPLFVNKKGIDRPLGFSAGGTAAQAKYAGADMVVLASQGARLQVGHRLTLVSQGVIITQREATAPGLPCEVIAQCDALRRNASGSDVVDGDPATVAVFSRMRAVVLEVTEAAVQALSGPHPSDEVRDQLAALLVGDDPGPELKAILEHAPLLPGPGGEWYAVSDFKSELIARRPIRYALEPCPPGSYPVPTVLLTGLQGDPNLALLPGPPTHDVKKQVEKQARASLNKARWGRQPQEPVVVDVGQVAARAVISEPGLTGEVALVRAGTGAFVRFLCRGRFVQQGEVQSLSPLRLRATVDWQRPVPEALWAEMPTRKLFSVAARAIESAALKALQEALTTRAPDAVLLAHTIDLLERWARSGKSLGSVPAWLANVPLFSALDGTRVSLATLGGAAQWAYTSEPTEHGLLSGERVLLLDDASKVILSAWGAAKLVDVTRRLSKEREVRRRLGRPREKAVLGPMAAVLKLEGEKFSGEVGVPVTRDSQLTLRLLKGGIPIETTTLTPLYGVASAVVDCADFEVNDGWDTVKRNATFDAALRAVRTAEARLAQVLLARGDLWNSLPPGATVYLLALLLKEADLGPNATSGPTLKALLDARLFSTSKGVCTLRDLKANVDAQAALYVRGPQDSVEAEGLFVVLASDELADGLGTLLRRTPQRPDDALQRLKALKAYRRAPVREPQLDPGDRPRTAVQADAVQGEVGLGLQAGEGANLELLVEKRLWREERVPSSLPLVGVLDLGAVDPLTNVLPAKVLQQMMAAVRLGEDWLVRWALNNQKHLDARRLMLAAIGDLFENRAGPGLKALLQVPIFPCTDGTARSVLELEKAGGLQLVTEALSGTPASGHPVVVAKDPDVAAALRRFGAREDVTVRLAREFSIRAHRDSIAPRKRIEVEGEALFRRAFSQGGFEGEVAITIGHPRRLELFTERKPFCSVDGELADPLMAAVNGDALSPGPDGLGVKRDKTFRAMMNLVDSEAEALAGELAAAFPSLPPARQELCRLPALKLAVWLSKRDLGQALAELPLLETTTGAPLPLSKLLATRHTQQAVRYSAARIAPLDAERQVWCPRPWEREVLEPLHLKLTDYSSELQHAEEVRSRPLEVSLAVPGFRSWVEPVSGQGCDGEVALREKPEPTLTIDVLRERAHLELWSSKHPIGAAAKVNCDGLTPTAGWKRAVRNRAFRSMVEEVEAALERLLARRLSDGPHDAEHRRYALAALGWERPHGGPLGQVLPTLPLFVDSRGAPVTLGAVVDEQARKRRLAVARSGLTSAEGLVLLDDDGNRLLLAKLKFEFEDVSSLLEQAQALEQSRRSRRLSRLSVEGEVLARVPVDRDGARGELALLTRPRGAAVLTLAREGIAVAAHAVEGGLPVVGVVDSPMLEVNADWTSARPDGKLQALISERIETLYLSLAARAESAAPELKEQLRALALQFLLHRGMEHAAALDRMTGAALALARVPLFVTPAGEWLSLAALADHAALGEKVGVLARRLFRPDVGEGLVVEAEALDAPWIDSLKAVLGPSSIERIENVADYKRNLAEADPRGGTPLLRGLLRLRKQLKLLRAGALGRLTPDELEDVRLTTVKMKRRIEYDPRRRLLLLDENDPQVVRALEEAVARPERLYVLLAACYGEVNRALERITDAHEADLLSALAVHLASNPEHLSPGPTAADKGQEP